MIIATSLSSFTLPLKAYDSYLIPEVIEWPGKTIPKTLKSQDSKITVTVSLRILAAYFSFTPLYFTCEKN